jgi:hypothetical protein
MEGAFALSRPEHTMFRWGKNKAKEAGSGLADGACSFCKAERAAVQKLVASPDTAICDRCAPLVIGALEEGGEPDLADSFPFIVASLAHIIANPVIGEERATAAGGTLESVWQIAVIQPR